MASVEELDSSLKLLTRHSAKCINSLVKSCAIDESKFFSVSGTVNSPIQSFFGAYRRTRLVQYEQFRPAQTISPGTTAIPAFDYSVQGLQDFCDSDVRGKEFYFY